MKTIWYDGQLDFIQVQDMSTLKTQRLKPLKPVNTTYLIHELKYFFYKIRFYFFVEKS